MTRRLGFYALALTAILPLGCTSTSVPDDETAKNVTIETGMGTRTRTGSTTGTQEMTTCGGWFPAEPNHVMTVEDSMSMTVRATSTGDVRLWLLGGQSNFCGEGTAAQEVFRFWTRGTIEVYVGTANQGEQLDYELEFIED